MITFKYRTDTFSRGLGILCLSWMLAFVQPVKAEQLIRLDHDAFEIFYNCELRMAAYVVSETKPDRAQNDRVQKFSDDPLLRSDCQAFSTDSFKTTKGMPKFDRGHLLDQNSLDNNVLDMVKSNYFSNIVPMNAANNRRGLWRESEKLTECLRDTDFGPLTVVAGVIPGTDESNDYFTRSHGMVTPDYLFKIIRTAKGHVLALLMPNDSTPKHNNAHRFITTIANIERQSGYMFEMFSNVEKHQKATGFWDRPEYCDLS